MLNPKCDRSAGDTGWVLNRIPPSYWILSPLKDLALVLLTPVLVLLAFDLARRFGWVDLLTAFALVLAVAHYVPGMMRAYGDRALYHQYRVRFLVVPLVLFAVSLTFTYLDLHAVTLILMLWGGWHWMMQSYGFGRIYDAKARSVSAVTAWLDRALCVSWFVSGLFVIHGTFTSQLRTFYRSGGPLLPGNSFKFFSTSWLILTGFVTAWWLFHTVQGFRRRRPANPLKVLFLAVTFAFLAYTSSLGEISLQGYAMFESCHDIQYLAIVWLFNRNRAEKDAGAGEFIRYLFRPRATLIALYIGMCLAFGTIRNLSDLTSSEHVMKISTSLIVTFALFHYYLDGFIWKIREKSTRQSLGVNPLADQADLKKGAGKLLPERERPGGCFAPKVLDPFCHWPTLLHVGWRHVLLWLLFIVPVIVLGIAEETGKVAGKVEIERKVVEASPASPAANLALCGVLFNSGQLDEALTACRKTLELSFEWTKAHELMGRVLAKKGKFKEATEHFQKILRIDPNNATAHYNLGNVLHHQGKVTEAKVQFEHALRIKPDYAEAYNSLGVMLAQLGPNARAKACFEQALRIAPEYAEAHNNLGVLLLNEGNRLEAEVHFQRALRIRPANAEVHSNLGAATWSPSPR